MIEIIINSLPVFLAIFLGYLSVKKNWVKKGAEDTVATIAFYIAGPFFIFKTLYGTGMHQDNIFLLAVPPVVFFSMLAVSYTAGISVFRLNRAQLGAMILCFISFGAGAVYPFVSQNFTPDVMQNFITVDVYLFMLYLVFASVVAANFSAYKNHGTNSGVSRYIKDPFLIAIITTVCINISGIRIPDHILDLTGFFSGPFFFLAAFLTGITFRFPKPEYFKKVFAVFTVRVVTLAGLAIAGFSLLHLSRTQMQPFILVFASQFSILAITYAREFGLDDEFASQLVVFSMAAQLVIYPFVILTAKFL